MAAGGEAQPIESPAADQARAYLRDLEERTAWIDALGDVTLLASVVYASSTVLRRLCLRLQAMSDEALNVPPSPTLNEDKLLMAQEVAALMKVSVSWLHHQPTDLIPGRVQHRKHGTVYWREGAVRQWIAAGCPKGPGRSIA